MGGLIGPPLAGWLADASAGSTVPITLALLVAVVAFVLSLAIPTRRDVAPVAPATSGAAVP